MKIPFQAVHTVNTLAETTGQIACATGKIVQTTGNVLCTAIEIPAVKTAIASEVIP